jgi:hypothetical protein
MLIKHMAMMPLKIGAIQYRKSKGNLSRPSLSTGGRQTSKMLYFLPLCFLLLGGGLVGCGNSFPLGIGGININNPGVNVTKISDIPQKQNAFTTIYLKGQVASRAPFLASGAYKLQDATGTIWVITNQTLPNVGDEVLIEGQLQFQSIPVGGQQLGEVYVQEQQQLARKAGQPGQPVAPKGRAKR